MSTKTLLREFAKITNDNKQSKKSKLYGTIVTDGNSKYVKIDGSDINTPITYTTEVNADERVIVSIDNHVATVIGNLTDPSVGNNRVEGMEGSIGDFEHLFAGNITADNILAGSITADKIMAGTITADKIMAGTITAQEIAANAIKANHITANSIEAKHIKADTITSDHIQSNTITADNIQTGTITAGSGIIAEGAIGSAQISTLDAAKITSGTIDTSDVMISGANGNLRIMGNRLQVFQGIGPAQFERVSLGDVNADGETYGLRVRGADGTTILLDENGVTEEGITDGSITNDKINPNANIEGGKLDIDSVIKTINEDGSSTINSIRIDVDSKNLSTVIQEINDKSDKHGEDIKTNTSSITANSNSIKMKVDEQIYQSDKTNMTTQLNKNTSSIDVLKTEIQLKVESTDIENAINAAGEVTDSKINQAKAEIKITTDRITQNVTQVSNTADVAYKKATTVETTVDGIKQEVSSKVGIEEVKSTIQQNPESVKIGFNGINDRININERSMDFTAVNGNRDMLLYGGQTCIYNNTNNTFMATFGNALKTSQSNYKGVGVLVGKHANAFVIARDPNWDDILSNRSPNPTQILFVNFTQIDSTTNGLKGIHARDTLYIEGNITGIGATKPVINGFRSIASTDMVHDTWRSPIDNSTVMRFDGSVNKVKMGKNIDGNGYIAQNFSSMHSSKMYLDNIYALNGNHGKLLMRTNGYDMFNGCNWDWSGYNLSNVNVKANSLYTDSFRYSNGYHAFGKHPYNNNMNNGTNWDWQGYNIVNAKIYTRDIKIPIQNTKMSLDPEIEPILDEENNLDLFSLVNKLYDEMKLLREDNISLKERLDKLENVV